MAHALGTVGVVTRLHRVQDGPFDIKQAVSLEDDLKILPLEYVLEKLTKLEVSDEMAKRIQNGQRIKEKKLTKGLPVGLPVIVWNKEKAIAVMHIEKDVLHPDCVLI